MAKKARKAVKRTVNTSIRKTKNKKATKNNSIRRKPISKKNAKSIRSPTKPLSSKKSYKKSQKVRASNHSLRTSARIKKLRSPPRSSPKRIIKEINAQYRSNPKRNVKQKKVIDKSPPSYPSKRNREIVAISESKNQISPKKKISRKPPSTLKSRNSEVNNELESDEYEVEKICDIKFENEEEMYLVKWKGFGVKDNTWEPRKNLLNANGVINDFHKEHNYEVECICGSRRVEGKRQYRVRWKGWPPSCDTWEVRDSLMKGAKLEVMRFEKVRKKRMA